MNELFLSNTIKDINSLSTQRLDSSTNLFGKSDPVYDYLRYYNPRSCYKKFLMKILARLYSCQILIIIFSFLFGFISFEVPAIFIYYSTIPNIFMSTLIPCFVGLFISIFFIILPCIDSKRHKYMLSAKWERKNIVGNLRDIFIILFLMASLIFFYFFYENILNDHDIKIRFDFNLDGNSYELLSDFVFKYILYISILDTDKTYEVRNNKIKLISGDWDINNLRNILRRACYPVVLLCFFTLIKIFLIDVRQTIEKIIVFTGILVLFLFECFVCSSGLLYLKVKNFKIASLFQCVIIVIILLGYILWTVNHALLLYKKRKDKNFAIRKYNYTILFLFILIDIIACIGYCIITISVLYSLVTFHFMGETYKHLYYANKILKIGFMPASFGNAFYFGYYFLAKIFRPIAIEFAPYELKNKYYIKANRKLYNFLHKKKRTLKEKIKKIFD